ncbi:MAG: ABC transporter permease [Peptococcales bacterium]|jgi:peptide/nickel transport system permease protein
MNKRIKLYILILIMLTVIFTYGSLLYPFSPVKPTGESLEKPSLIHFLGTDDLGIDIFAQISRGFFISLLIGICTALLSFFVGGLSGVLSGYVGGKIDVSISFFINLFLSIPQLPVMIVLGAFFGQSMGNVVIIIAFFSWAAIAKVVRAKTIQIKNQDYIKIAKSYGASFYYIFLKHMFHDIFPLLFVNTLAVIGRAIVQEASLAFLGLSDPLSKSWGLMINKAINFPGIYFTEYWLWWLLPPLACLTITIYCIRMISREIENMITS